MDKYKTSYGLVCKASGAFYAFRYEGEDVFADGILLDDNIEAYDKFTDAHFSFAKFHEKAIKDYEMLKIEDLVFMSIHKDDSEEDAKFIDFLTDIEKRDDLVSMVKGLIEENEDKFKESLNYGI